MIRQNVQQTSASDFLPAAGDLLALRRASQDCCGCVLHQCGSQAVFGAGPTNARLMFIGHQPEPEDEELGEPFSGPTGRLFDAVLADVGIDRRHAYLTNIVKHFPGRRANGEPKHATVRQIRACFPWLEAELAVVRPAIVVCLGAVAARAILGAGFRVSQRHGEVISTNWAPWTMATFHPAAILHSPDAIRADVQQAFAEDLRRAAEHLHELCDTTAKRF
jgi:uracil-DNA glycosylase family protein